MYYGFTSFAITYRRYAQYGPENDPAKILSDLNEFDSNNDFPRDFAKFEAMRMTRTMKYYALQMMSVFDNIRALCDDVCPIVNQKRSTDMARLDQGIARMSSFSAELRKLDAQVKLATSLRNQMLHITAHSEPST